MAYGCIWLYRTISLYFYYPIITYHYHHSRAMLCPILMDFEWFCSLYWFHLVKKVWFTVKGKDAQDLSLKSHLKSVSTLRSSNMAQGKSPYQWRLHWKVCACRMFIVIMPMCISWPALASRVWGPKASWPSNTARTLGCPRSSPGTELKWGPWGRGALGTLREKQHSCRKWPCLDDWTCFFSWPFSPAREQLYSMCQTVKDRPLHIDTENPHHTERKSSHRFPGYPAQLGKSTSKAMIRLGGTYRLQKIKVFG